MKKPDFKQWVVQFTLTHKEEKADLLDAFNQAFKEGREYEAIRHAKKGRGK